MDILTNDRSLASDEVSLPCYYCCCCSRQTRTSIDMILWWPYGDEITRRKRKDRTVSNRFWSIASFFFFLDTFWSSEKKLKRIVRWWHLFIIIDSIDRILWIFQILFASNLICFERIWEDNLRTWMSPITCRRRRSRCYAQVGTYGQGRTHVNHYFETRRRKKNMGKDYYQILQLIRSATDSDIKSA